MNTLFDSFQRILGLVGLSTSPTKQTTLPFVPLPKQTAPIDTKLPTSLVVDNVSECQKTPPSTPKRKLTAPNLGSPSRRLPPSSTSKRQAVSSTLTSPFQTKLSRGINQELSISNDLLMETPSDPKIDGISVRKRVMNPENQLLVDLQHTEELEPLQNSPKLLSSPRRTLRPKTSHHISVKPLIPIPAVRITRRIGVKNDSDAEELSIQPKVSPQASPASDEVISATMTPMKKVDTLSLGKSILIRESSKAIKQNDAPNQLLAQHDHASLDAFSKLITSSPKRPVSSKSASKEIEQAAAYGKEGKENVNPFLLSTPGKATSSNLPSLNLPSCSPPNINQVSLSGSNLFSPEFPHLQANPRDNEVKDIVMHDEPLSDPIKPGSISDDEHSDEEVDEDFFEAVTYIGRLPPKSSLVPHPALKSQQSAMVEPGNCARRYNLIPAKDASDDRLTLVLDLDETLVHCAVGLMTPRDTYMSLEIPGRPGPPLEVSVRWRPGLFDFLKAIKGKFEVIVFTASQKIYADTLLDILDPTHEIIKYRLFRDSCRWVSGNFIKDLDVLERDLKRTIIVDNAYQAYAYHVSNGYPIVSWFDDMNDTELLKLLRFLAPLNDQPSLNVQPIVRSTFPLYRRVFRYRRIFNITTESDDYPADGQLLDTPNFKQKFRVKKPFTESDFEPTRLALRFETATNA